MLGELGSRWGEDRERKESNRADQGTSTLFVVAGARVGDPEGVARAVLP